MSSIEGELESRAEAEHDHYELERIIRLGRWLDHNFDQVVTALCSVRDEWEPNRDVVDRGEARIYCEQFSVWQGLVREVTETYESTP